MVLMKNEINRSNFIMIIYPKTNFLFKQIIIAVFVLCVGALQKCAIAQVDSIQILIKDIDQSRNSVINLQNTIEKKTNILLKNSAEIEKIKSKKSENIITSNKLQELLAQSKLVSEDLDSLEEQLNLHNKLIETKAEALLKKVDSEMLLLFRSHAGIQRKSNLYSAVIKELETLYNIRRRYKILITDNHRIPTELQNIEIKDEFLGKSIAERIDLLKDQQDFLQSIVLIIDDKLRMAKDWIRLSQQASDLLEDLRLQQTNDENIYSSETKTAKNGLDPNIDITFGGNAIGTTRSKEVGTETLALPLNFDSIFLSSPERMKSQIQLLEDYKNQLTCKADSIAKIIKEYQK